MFLSGRYTRYVFSFPFKALSLYIFSPLFIFEIGVVASHLNFPPSEAYRSKPLLANQNFAGLSSRNSQSIHIWFEFVSNVTLSPVGVRELFQTFFVTWPLNFSGILA